jgi:CBS domain-containing protein
VNGNDILNITMSGLESGLRVLHIAAFRLKDCKSSDNAAEVLCNPLLKDFDRIPVRDNGRIVGVLERKSDVGQGSCKEHMRPLDESILISAEEPLTRLLPLLQDSAYRLVLRGPEIQGIVTRSDIVKLPVRLVAFALITHLEMVMAQVIQTRCPSEEQWLQFLSVGRQQKVNEKLAKRKAENLHLPLLELTDFCDKRTILKKLLTLGNDFEDALVSVEELRNTLAHAGGYAQDADKLNEFLDRLRLTQKWIDYLRPRT